MVILTKDSMRIEVKTGGAPHENYVGAMNDIISLLQDKDDEMSDKHYHLLELLRQMLPTEEQARALFDEIKDL